MLVAYRNRRATSIRLAAPFLFMLLALLIQKALDADTRRAANFSNINTPVPMPVPSVPDCNSDLYIADKKCHTFIYTSIPSTDPAAAAIVAKIQANNEPAIPDVKVRRVQGDVPTVFAPIGLWGTWPCETFLLFCRAS